MASGHAVWSLWHLHCQSKQQPQHPIATEDLSAQQHKNTSFQQNEKNDQTEYVNLLLSACVQKALWQK